MLLRMFRVRITGIKVELEEERKKKCACVRVCVVLVMVKLAFGTRKVGVTHFRHLLGHLQICRFDMLRLFGFSLLATCPHKVIVCYKWFGARLPPGTCCVSEVTQSSIHASHFVGSVVF